MAAAALLTVDDLALRRGGRLLLSGFSLDVAPGEVVAVRGPSGSGKTTLLRSLAQLQDPARGSVRLRGRSPREIGWPAWRRQVCLAAQLPAVFSGTVHANLSRPHTFRGAAGTFDPDRARHMLDSLLLRDVDLTADAERLSVGQQQRFCVARVLLLDPAVVLLDEPTSALDPAAATALEDSVRTAVDERQSAAVVVTHDPARTQRWCDRTLDLAAWRPEDDA